MIGRTLSHYKVQEKIGEGGMGEVYLAKDTKLDREVAVKVLPATFSENKERLARFEREARLLASLNHPNIAAIYELEESDGVHFLALEYVPGETLAERIKRGPIPVDEALPLFKQIAEGLEAAHEKGVIHRDLKPANIKVTPEGKVKVLDFGLAKAMAGETPTQGLSESPTIDQGATETGVLLGTAPYMSPEQARGKPVDKRIDIWAFGCCLYEALTGRAAFAGETVSDTIAKILEHEADWDLLPEATPFTLRSLLRRCLRKDESGRLHDMADVRIEIEEASAEPTEMSDSRTRLSQGSRAPWWAIPILALLVVGVVAVTYYLRPQAPRPVTRLQLGVQPAEWLAGGVFGQARPIELGRTSIALSPDGSYLVYSAGDRDGIRLYIRPMDAVEARPITGTDGGTGPFFSPDGQWIGFWAQGRLKKIQIDGGPPVDLCEVPSRPIGASWGSNNNIVFAAWEGIHEISADGGEPRTLTTLAEGEYSHRLPQILPGGEAVLFTARKQMFGGWEKAHIDAYSFVTGERKTLIENGADARYSPTGHLVFARMATLMAVPFDLERLEITGGPVGVVRGVYQAVNATNATVDSGAAQFSFSASGTLAYVPGGIIPDGECSLLWVDRRGVAEPLPAPTSPYLGARISPDGLQVAAYTVGLKRDIWVYDISREISTRLTTEDSSVGNPIWTPDGTRITFSSDRAGSDSVYWIPADGSGTIERLTTMEPAQPSSWSPDGQELVLHYWDEQNAQGDIWILPNEGEPRPFTQTPKFWESHAVLSPDGRWLAYRSNKSGMLEVYVTPYPGPGPVHQISNDGGTSPAWGRNGKELFYRSLWDSKGFSSMMAVDLSTEPNFTVGRPRELFKGKYGGTLPVRSYDVTNDGQKFLMIQDVSPPREPVTQIQIVLNWFEELKRLVPTN